MNLPKWPTRVHPIPGGDVEEETHPGIDFIVDVLPSAPQLHNAVAQSQRIHTLNKTRLSGLDRSLVGRRRNEGRFLHHPGIPALGLHQPGHPLNPPPIPEGPLRHLSTIFRGSRDEIRGETSR